MQSIAHADGSGPGTRHVEDEAMKPETATTRAASRFASAWCVFILAPALQAKADACRTHVCDGTEMGHTESRQGPEQLDPVCSFLPFVVRADFIVVRSCLLLTRHHRRPERLPPIHLQAMPSPPTLALAGPTAPVAEIERAPGCLAHAAGQPTKGREHLDAPRATSHAF